MDEFNIQ